MTTWWKNKSYSERSNIVFDACMLAVIAVTVWASVTVLGDTPKPYVIGNHVKVVQPDGDVYQRPYYSFLYVPGVIDWATQKPCVRRGFSSNIEHCDGWQEGTGTVIPVQMDVTNQWVEVGIYTPSTGAWRLVLPRTRLDELPVVTTPTSRRRVVRKD